jgi:hypothetical protein
VHTEKKCSKCGKGRSQGVEFGKCAVNSDGLKYACKACTNASNYAARNARKAKGRAPSSEDFDITWEESATPPPAPAVASATPIPVAPEAPLSTGERLEIARLRQQLAGMRTYAKDLEGQVLTSDNMRQVLGTLGLPNVQTNPDWLQGANRQQSTHGTAVLFFSDNHFDEVVNPNEIGGCNAYDRDIAVRRIRNTFKHAITLLKGYMSRPKYDGIVCALGGDHVSGNIHDELVETNAAPINETLIVLEGLLIEGIGALADEFGKVHVPCVTGNHGRMHKKPRAKQRGIHNFEWAVFQRLAGYFRPDSRVTFDIPEGPDAMFTVYQRRFCLTHGDQFRGGGGIGGIMVPILRGISKKQMRQQAIGDTFDVAMMGHWHQYIHMNQLIINGSSKGYDEYAAANNFAFEPPQQALFIEHPKVGATFRMPVLCDKEG